MKNDTNISTAAAALGRKGGLAKTEAKAAAVRKNGAKGGRPRERFELTFWGGAMNQDNRPVRFRRHHESLEAAKAEATKIKGKGVGAPHTAIIYGPGLGKDGIAA